MKVTFKADFSKAIKDMGAYTKEKISALRDVTNDSAINIQAGAKQRCAVDTGRLRSSIAIEPATWSDISLRIGTKVFYGVYVEWGTGKYASHPDIPGRSTPWAFPVPKTGRKVYNFKTIEVDGQAYYVTEGAKPHPFLLPSFEEEKPHYLAAIKGVLRS